VGKNTVSILLPKGQSDGVALVAEVQTAAHCVTQAAEHCGPMIFAQMGMLQAIHRHHKRVFNPDRKDTHWGKRKLKRDQ
jgi:hypothetical protein